MTAFYTLAIGAGMLLATVPDGESVDAAVSREWEMIASRDDKKPAFEIVHNCVLTDDEPQDDDCVVWKSGNSGWIIDENGTTWRYALREAQSRTA